ncbi:hypothetical protein DVH05_007186 [Phytophthora capsici]|nr:hypothetical protein DVH05_007186 [Phytophthora capsici]|eukprot:jgi/Phyca11/511670/fgenesh2_kg.PHYCAscaffold_94_\
MSEKRYKSAYFMRKQEKEDLKQEVRRLEDELAQLDPTPVKKRENAVMSDIIRQQQLGIASLQSAVSPLMEQCPLYSFISLKESWEDRCASLTAVRENKFKAAYEYVSNRSEMVQLQLSDERFETANGDVCCVIFQTMHLEGVESLEQVYNALLFSINNAEISISERLGHLTVRDDYESVDGSIFNSRIVSTNDEGVSTELNCIMMAQLFDGTEGVSGGEPCGMVVIDYVDEDDLYPYLTSERVRKDVSGAFVLTQHRNDESHELVVTLRRAAFVKLHRPEFKMADVAWQELQEESPRWGDVVVRTLRGMVYSQP